MLYRARQVVPVVGPPIADGAVLVEDGRIVAVDRAEALDAGSTACEDLGRVALLPGLVNAHCHLELTALAGRLPAGGTFVDWVRGIIAFKAQLPVERYAQGARDGAMRLLAAGTTTVGDIVSQDGVVEALAGVPIRKVVFWEAIGIGSRTDTGIERIRKRLAESEPQPLLTFGIAPHAPYSTAPALYRECAALAKKHDFRLTTHLAETTEEIEFLELGEGPFRDLLDEMHLLTDTYRPERRSPLDFLLSVGGLSERTLIAHMNHPGAADSARLAEFGASVAYCPGAHEFFGRRRHPFRDFIDAGVNVCLGTDSAAGNRTLSILEEMRTVFRQNRSLWPQVILKTGTVNGAAALGLGESVGALVAGFQADMIAVPLRAGGPVDPVENVLSSDEQPVRVMVAGRTVVESAETRTCRPG